jgi:hypothetical protein
MSNTPHSQTDAADEPDSTTTTDAGTTTVWNTLRSMLPVGSVSERQESA